MKEAVGAHTGLGQVDLGLDEGSHVVACNLRECGASLRKSRDEIKCHAQYRILRQRPTAPPRSAGVAFKICICESHSIIGRP